MTKMAQVFHFDLYGKREEKYRFLSEHSLSSVPWTELHPTEPELFFVPKDFEAKAQYDQGFSVVELFPLNNVGIVTAKDGILIAEDKNELLRKVSQHYQIDADAHYVKPVAYRPFDTRWLYYDTQLVERSREKVMQHFTQSGNVGLAGIKHNKEKAEIGYSSVFVTKEICEARLADRFITYVFPLYLYPSTSGQQTLDHSTERKPNLDSTMVEKIAKGLKLGFTPEQEAQTSAANDKTTFAPIDLLDYIYAVLHSPRYRETYKEFLKIDFPRIPYPQDAGTFWQLAKLGGELRQWHLLEHPALMEATLTPITQYPIAGDNVVGKIRTENHPALTGTPPKEGNKVRVFINDKQYFDNVPQHAWEFYIGGYQPTQKWLKDRKDRALQFEDIMHYQNIIRALSETHRLMQEINAVFSL